MSEFYEDQLRRTLVKTAAESYILAIERGATGIKPEDALEVVLERRRCGALPPKDNLLGVLKADEEGQAVLREMGMVVGLIVDKLSEIDPKE